MHDMHAESDRLFRSNQDKRGGCWEGDETKSNAFREKERGKLGYHLLIFSLLLGVPARLLLRSAFFRRLKLDYLILIC